MNIVLRIAFVLYLAALALSSATLAAEVPLSYKGVRVPPLPPGHQDLGGYLINPDAATEYAVIEVWFDKKKMWWLQKMLSRDAKGKPQWEIVAVTEVPKVPKGYYFQMGTCEKGGVAVPEIIAVAKREDKERLENIHSAWIANLNTHSFEPYSTKGVVCINEGFGV